ncbi:twin-arginine translocase subunit TatC [Sphingomonas koreensis]|uniref:Sec-independent protein translocase protein TatC n=1 Tax=Sphingomonas koreensis TaxID=93064 RepID=A0A1L6JE78_9SPHN|nr:twin-arginine translocase subunit TatC [Sphingomonas koreensis]APR54229.1 twin arginine-targeting protein translocase TatC [Sphingomonas koreensis]MDC7809239.1 twin-arginine translocase subunit TatC [Sphingomonas koreensis]PJI90162.1 sec-independent protein translocase protein TatC [Sphingomonas koreensis]RSU18562.1 twin-arginine translocase subunit TatC [Sphingomonas koreensis]RSU22388.1 twin-arginine translocase subunit TatC [Sphingomonas koreensis]
MSDNELEGTEAPLLDHLIELRRRLLYCVLALVLAFAVCFYFVKPIYGFLVHPLAQAGQDKLVFTSIMGGFFVELKVAFFAAVMVAFPIVAVQLWQFVAPGLYRKEKKALLPFLLATPALFIAGASLAYWVTIPTALHFLLGYQGQLGGGVEQVALPDAEKYLGFVMQFLFAFGISFLLPVLLMLLERAGIVTYEQLKGAWRYSVVAAFAIAAVLTPPDIGSQLLLAIPLCGLYFLSLVAIWFTRRRREKESEKEAAAEAAAGE